MIGIIPIFSKLLSIVMGLLGISFIVVFHEFGHFIFCKLFKVHTPTFSIGIGKILASKQIGDTNFCISAGPIGGYVEVASDYNENGYVGFNQIPYYQKVLIMLGGIGFNFMLTYFILVGLFFTGMPETAAGPYEPATTKIAKIAPNSINGDRLEMNDAFIEINHQSINNDLKQARKIISELVNEKQNITQAIIERDGKQIELLLALKGEKITPSLNKQLEINMQTKPGLSILKSINMAAESVKFYLNAIISGLKEIFYAKTAKGFVGPLMAVAATSKSAQAGFACLLFLLAIISLNLGFMNLLPLPIFDGGQFVIFTTEAIIGHQLSERIRHWIATGSWILAIGLLITFTIRDACVLFWH